MDYGLSKEMSPDDERQPKWKKQREERGFDDTELWNLDVTLAKFLVPRLEQFKEFSVGHPGFLTQEEWDTIIDEMIAGFKEVLKDEYCYTDSGLVKKALDHFNKYFNLLWT